MLHHYLEGLFTSIILFSSPDESTADLRLSSEDSDSSSLSLTVSTTALATIMATNSLSVVATSSGCSVHINHSTSDVSDSGYLDIMEYNRSLH